MAVLLKSDGTVELSPNAVGAGDIRLSDSRVPSAHATSHVDGGTDEITSALDPRAYPVLEDVLASRPASGVTGRQFYATDTAEMYLDIGGAWVLTGGSGAVPAHAATHADGGADEITTALDPRAYPVLEDVLANRPASGVTGRQFYATDTADMYLDIGGAWVQTNPAAHASTHQDGGSDEIATTAPAAGAIPKALASGQLDPNFVFCELIKQSADATNNAIALANTDLVFSFDAGSVYLIDLFLLWKSAATTTGISLAFDTSSAVSVAALAFAHVLANTGTLSGGDAVADATKRGVSSGNAAANVDIPLLASGLLVTSLASGTCRLQFGSEVALSTVTFRANSTMRVMKVV